MSSDTATARSVVTSRLTAGSIARFLQKYAVAVMIVLLMALLTALSDSFLTTQNLINILNQNAPLAIMAAAMTLVIIGGGFDLSVGATFAVAGVSAAWVALHVHPLLGLAIAPCVGLALGLVNGVTITVLNIHSFLATLATSLVFRGIAILITGGTLIPVRLPEFTWLGRGRIGPVYIAVIVMIVFAVALMVLLNRTAFGRKVFAVGGNEEAAILSGIRTRRVKIVTFAIAGFAAGLASAIAVSRISMGQATAGAGMELEAIAAVIIGGTSIYGGQGAIWRSLAGVIMLALINNGFNILNADPFFKDLTTGLIIVAAVAISASGRRR
ncbi:ribose ABC transporter permease [Mesorhizobium sp. L-8-10]|uniref:ABC transporter permease n=1 Tax=unclassified Mesorhizobium TaxID=325217 RepID=UPI001936AE4B|nr:MULTISPECIES: ABC transporter permease [unclassified Mesorhizobium]BCH27522.1 ribose ABC transporter permease [Mesorhizobium sp. L-8-3]BCH35480.1 ribose ABC transporter permease [Mesorhizobium sp. L-8-10]